MPKYTNEQIALNALLWNTLDKSRGALSSESALTIFYQLLFYKFLDDNSAEIWIDGKCRSLNFREELRLSSIAVSSPPEYLPVVFGQAMISLEEINQELLKDIFTQTDIQYFHRAHGSESGLVIADIIHGLHKLSFEKKALERENLDLTNVFTNLLDWFTENELKRNGFFLTPPALRSLLANLIQVGARPNETILDPNCGPGTLLMEVVRLSSEPVTRWTAYGQERYINFFSLAKMQWLLNGLDPAHVGLGDSLRNPYLASQKELFHVDKIVSCPPFNVSGWGQGWADHDQYERFKWGVPPANKADYAHMLHTVASLKPDGIGLLVCTAGVLFREGQEGKLRQKLIEENLISAVLWLPAGLFSLWNIPLCIICIDKSRGLDHTNLLMVDLKAGLNEESINTLTHIYAEFKLRHTLILDDNIPARIVERTEIVANNYNLNTARYIVDQKNALPADSKSLADDIESLKKKLITIDEEINRLKKQLKME